MSYKIIKQTINGQRREVVSNGWLDYDSALERAMQFESEMIDSGDCEMRYMQTTEKFVVETEG
jgi:hypothetical protein